VGIRHWQVVIAQQGTNMRAARLALVGITHHHDVGNGQWRFHGFRRTGVDFIVQRCPLRMLMRLALNLHAILLMPL
jgi:hypothetical protein